MVKQLFYLIATLVSLRCIFACSNIFSYSNDYRSGTFAIDGAVDSTIQTTMQLSVAEFLSESNTGSLNLQNYDVFHTLSTTGKMYYVVQFPISQSVPQVTLITTNGRVICTGNPYPSLQRTRIMLTHTYKSSYGHNNRFGNQRIPDNDIHLEDNDVFPMSDENPLMSPPTDNHVFPSHRRNTTPPPNFGFFLNIGDQSSPGGQQFIPRIPQPDDSMRREQNGFHAPIGSPPFNSIDNREQSGQDGFSNGHQHFIQQSNRNVGSGGRSSNLEPSRQPTIRRVNPEEQSGFRRNPEPSNQPLGLQPSQPNRGTTGSDDREPVSPNKPGQDRPSNRSPVGCGTVVHGLSSHIYFGESINYGSWPWLVPLFQANAPDMRYLCGGTLVSPRAVITSAHCFDEANNLDSIYVVVGRFNLLEWTNRNSTIIKSTVNIHPHYRKNDANFDADIAVLSLEEEATINEYVRPACVWKRTILLDDIVNKSGVVAGWGQTEQGVYSTLPKQIMTKVVSNQVCFTANPTLQSLTTGRNFCAGKLDGTGPCRGDSGGGLLFNEDGRWTLRGIVSAIINTNIRDCDLSNYVVYTDVAQFHDWLDPLI